MKTKPDGMLFEIICLVVGFVVLVFAVAIRYTG